MFATAAVETAKRLSNVSKVIRFSAHENMLCVALVEMFYLRTFLGVSFSPAPDLNFLKIAGNLFLFVISVIWAYVVTDADVEK